MRPAPVRHASALRLLPACVAGLAALAVIAALTACSPPKSADRRDEWRVAVGDPMPDFALPDVTRKWVSFSQDYRGKPVVLAVFAT